ncbi:uncharacterized protein DS421_11g335030 [Arachis hypogaea]|nr:uncharacterized protein DS421_11g335030 [Arachis hypogaea]
MERTGKEKRERRKEMRLCWWSSPSTQQDGRESLNRGEEEGWPLLLLSAPSQTPPFCGVVVLTASPPVHPRAAGRTVKGESARTEKKIDGGGVRCSEGGVAVHITVAEYQRRHRCVLHRHCWNWAAELLPPGNAAAIRVTGNVAVITENTIGVVAVSGQPFFLVWILRGSWWCTTRNGGVRGGVSPTDFQEDDIQYWWWIDDSSYEFVGPEAEI